MGVYKKAVITRAGNALVARALAGDAEIRFSHARTSSCEYPDGTDFEELTELQDIQQTVSPSDAEIVNGTVVSIVSLFRNENVLKPYMIQNIGLYAMDGDREILFSISQAVTADQMPPYNGVAPSSFLYNIQLTVSNASSITVTVDPAGTASVQEILELKEKQKELEKSINATNQAVNKLSIPRNVTLLAGKWSTSYPYEQTVSVEGVTAADRVRVIGVVHQNGNNETQDKAIDKAAGQLMYNENGVKDGALTFRAKKKPAVDFTVVVIGAGG